MKSLKIRNAMVFKSLLPLRASKAAILLAAAASEPEASEQGSNPNLYMWVKISILTLAHCIMVPVGFYHNAARSVALKWTCVVAVWSFFHCFDFREDRSKFSGGHVLTVFWRVFSYYVNISTIFTYVIYISYSIDHVMFMFMHVNDYAL